jgi:putative flavoprotein involved in K+ transport
MADYLERYARHFSLPVRHGIKVERLWREGRRFRLSAGERCFEADNVIVAMANFQKPRVPAFAHQLAPEIRQLHSADYRNTSQLDPGDVLVVGAGNSGAEIAFEVAKTHRTILSGRYPSSVPVRMDTLAARFVLGVVFHHILTLDTPLGRRARGDGSHATTPLIRVKPADLAAAGVEHVARLGGVRDGLPMLEDGRTLAVRNVVWCTGYSPSFEWIELPIFGDHGPRHERGSVPTQPGLHFVGLHFQYALSSAMVQGVSRDAERVVRAVAAQASSRQQTAHARVAVPAAVE